MSDKTLSFSLKLETESFGRYDSMKIKRFSVLVSNFIFASLSCSSAIFASEIFSKDWNIGCNVEARIEGTFLKIFDGVLKDISKIEIKYSSDGAQHFGDYLESPKFSGRNPILYVQSIDLGDAKFYNTFNCYQNGLWLCFSSLTFENNLLSAIILGDDAERKISNLRMARHQLTLDIQSGEFEYIRLEASRYIRSKITHTLKGFCNLNFDSRNDTSKERPRFTADDFLPLKPSK
jgi:hypothetical protein